jgi:hypothetical protein
MKLLENKYMQSTGKYVLAVSTAAVALAGLSQVKKLMSKKINQRMRSLLHPYLSEEQITQLEQDEQYIDIAYRFVEYASLTPFFKLFLLSTLDLVDYKTSIQTAKQYHVKEFSRKGHTMIHAVRLMRTYLELKMPSILDEFDEVAADVQTKYEEDHEHLLYDAQMQY